MKKNFLSILLVSVFLCTSCEFSVSFDPENGFSFNTNETGNNSNNSQNNNQNENNSGENENQNQNQQSSQFLPINTIQTFYSSLDINVPIPDYVTSNENAYYESKYNNPNSLCFCIFGSNFTELLNYSEALLECGWTGDGYYEFFYLDTDAYCYFDMLEDNIIIVFAIDNSTQVTEKKVEFWSPFGSKYGAKLQTIVGDVSEKLGIEIEHKAISGYYTILQEMVSAIPPAKYPDIVTGYPDHFSHYHACKILKNLDDLTSSFKDDYYEAYMPENYIYDNDGTKHLYGVPFNKTTELLGYNGVFVDFCAEYFSDPTLKVLPETWDEWKSGDKVQKYKQALDELVAYKDGCWYASQDEDGTAHDFEKSATAVPGKVAVFDYREITSSQVALMSWDSTDNMFITLLKQWGAEYTELPEDQRTVSPSRRQGKILFANSANLEKTVAMLRYFNEMQKDKVFTIPQMINATYSSDAFKVGKVMFMVCSSGALGYNTENWSQRFRVTTIPYKDTDKKYVMSQGANLCLTDRSEDSTKAVQVIKELTTGEFQAEWAINTGFFPTSKSAQNSAKYQAFLNNTSFDHSNLTEVSFREGARVNNDHYINPSENWLMFVDEAFIGSAVVREVVKNVFLNVFRNIAVGETDSAYVAQINNILNDNQISQNINLIVDRY